MASPRDHVSPLRLDAVLQGGHAPLSDFVGSCRVQLHSLAREELNGRQGGFTLKTQHPDVLEALRRDVEVTM